MSKTVEGRDFGQFTPPITISAERAHRDGIIRYTGEEGTVIFRHPRQGEIKIPPHRQFPQIVDITDDLSNAVTSHANSPKDANGQTIYDTLAGEIEKYNRAARETHRSGGWEPDYGDYHFFDRDERLHLTPPAKLHRLGLVASIAMLNTDPEGKLSWREIREKLDNYVVGIVGASVGGNILEGVMRNVRPLRTKIADPDWAEITNLSRLNRGSLVHLTASRADRKDPRNPYSARRPNKAAGQAYEQQIVDPYAQFDVYTDGLTPNNVNEFLLGNDKGEPPVNLLVEEVDNFEMKIILKQLCRQYRIPLLTIGDFGHRAHVQFKDFARHPDLNLGFRIDDEELMYRYRQVQESGNREALFSFIEGACGPEFSADEFEVWKKGKGEQPTSSLPQSGATALDTGGIGGETITLYALGHKIPELRFFDAKQWRAVEL